MIYERLRIPIIILLSIIVYLLSRYFGFGWSLLVTFLGITSCYREYIDLFIKEGFIKVDEQYIVGERSKCYSFTPIYAQCINFKNIKYKSNYNREKNRNEDEKLEEEWIETMKEYFAFLKIDYEKALEFADNLYSDSNGDIRKGFQSQYLNIQKVKDRNYNITRDKNIKRLHTPLTNSKKEFRNFLTIENMQITCIDLSNSQPFLSLKLFDPSFWYSPNLSEFQLSQFGKFFPNHKVKNEAITFDSLGFLDEFKSNKKYENILKTIKGRGNDFTVFTEKVRTDQLYEHIKDEVAKTSGIIFQNKKEVKAMIFLTFFSSNHFFGQVDAINKRLFNELFPSVYNMFSAIKCKKKNLLALILQTLESHIFLDVIGRKLVEDMPGVPFFTIHDSIAISENYAEPVKRIISEKLEMIIGHIPDLKIEHWSKENLKN